MSMQGYNFTTEVRESLAGARKEAAELRHEYVGTEHILLSLIRLSTVASDVLQNLSIDVDAISAKILQTVIKGESAVDADDIPRYTARAKKTLELAMTEAGDLGHDYVGVEHLLLGILREEKSIAAQVLTAAGVTMDAMRHEVLRHPAVVKRTGRSAATPAEARASGATRLAGAFGMSDDSWRRHANPWSVYTRFAAIPAMIVAVWSRTWIGWWAVFPVTLVIAWLIVNPRAFAPVGPTSWAAKGIYGERLWVKLPVFVPAEYRVVLRRLIAVGIVGFAFLVWGLVKLLVWPTIFGATLVVLAQLWRIDRMGLLYKEIGPRFEQASSQTSGLAGPN